MDYITLLWTLVLLVSSSKFSNARLAANFQRAVAVRDIFVTKNFTIPNDPIASLPNSFSLTGNPAALYMCYDTNLQSYALVRDNESIPLFPFFASQMRFISMFANHIEFNIIIRDDQKMTFFCTFPDIARAKSFFQLVRGNHSAYEPQDFMVTVIEYYTEEGNERDKLIPQPTFLRQNFIGDRTLADAAEFEFRWERPGYASQSVSAEFTPGEYKMSSVINGKVVVTAGGDTGEYYILYFMFPKTARQFVDYIEQFADSMLEVPDNLRRILTTTQQLR